MTTIIAPDGKLVATKDYPLAGASSGAQLGPSGGAIPILGRDFITLSYETMYRRQVWIHVCVNKRAIGVARLPWKVYRMDDKGNRDRARDHDLTKLLATPWPGGSAWLLKEAIEGSLSIHGNALIAKFRGEGRRVKELWPVPWRSVRAETDESSLAVKRYWFRGDRKEIPIDPADVIHVRSFGANGQVGVSPMEPLRSMLQIEDAAQRWQASVFANSATPRGAFKTDKKLDVPSIGRLRAELNALYGGPDNAGRFGIFDQGLEWQAMALSAVDAALIDQRKLNREEAAAVYDLPLPMIGILDRATFSNITEQHKMLYMDCLGPELTRIEEAFMSQLVIPDFGYDPVFIEFDLAEVLKADVGARADAYMKLLAILSPNEIRRLENRPPIGDPEDPDNPANKPWISTALAPLGSVNPAALPPAPAPDEQDPTQTPAASRDTGNGHKPAPAWTAWPDEA